MKGHAEIRMPPEEPEKFADGAYEVPVFFHEEEKKIIIGISWVDIENGTLSASLDIDHQAFMNMGFELVFEETYFPHEGRKYSLHARKKSEDRVVVPLLNKAGKKIGEAYFTQEPTELKFESFQIVGEEAVEALGLKFALTEVGSQCNVTVFNADKKLV